MTVGNRRRESGQAAVEAALTLPITVFLILGSLQLFMVLQARLMAEHAAFKAVRTGSLSQGNCERMMHAALVTVLPTFTRTHGPTRLGNAFAARVTNKYNSSLDNGHDGDIVWLIRERPLRSALPSGDDHFFDNPDAIAYGNFRLKVRLVFWYPLQIPFVNWVIAKIALAQLGIEAYSSYNPLSPTGKGPTWTAAATSPLSGATLEGIGSSIYSEAAARIGVQNKYVMPIQATAAMRMMTPARRAFFNPQHCK